MIPMNNEEQAREKLIELHKDVLAIKADIKDMDKVLDYIEKNKLVK